MANRMSGIVGGRRGEHLVLLQVILVLVFVLMPVWNPLELRSLAAGPGVLRWAALVLLCGAGLILGLWGLVQIWTYLTPLPYPVPHNRLVRDGAYGIVRHPLYTSQLLAALGWTLFQLSLSHLAVLAAGFLFFDHKASREEAWLRERHPAYADYAKGVRKLVPWIY